MSAIPFTDRELRNAWRELVAVASPAAGHMRKNPHRLLMFYAVECGLKAVWLKRHSQTVFGKEHIEKTGHNLRKILKDLKVGAELSLPETLSLTTVTMNGSQEPRNGDVSILHQAWRYGGNCVAPSDEECVLQLEKILTWIRGELR